MSVVAMPFYRRKLSGQPLAAEQVLARPLDRPLRGLIVDRTPLSRQIVRRATSSPDCVDVRWSEAPSFRAAVALLASHPIDVTVLDPRSVDCDVKAFVRLAASLDHPAPVIVVISENDGPERIQDMLDAGVECYLPKTLPGCILTYELRGLITTLFGQGGGLHDARAQSE